MAQGIDNFGSLTVSGSTLAKNHATKGGTIDNEAGGTLVILNSTFAHNTATMGGGGISTRQRPRMRRSPIARLRTIQRPMDRRFSVRAL